MIRYSQMLGYNYLKLSGKFLSSLLAKVSAKREKQKKGYRLKSVTLFFMVELRGIEPRTF